MSGELNLPTIYVYSSQTLGFLNDILLFSKIDESYIAKDLDCTEENIQEIFEDKDISKGIIVIISDNLDKNGIIETIKDAENFSTFEEVQRLWCSNVYYVHWNFTKIIDKFDFWHYNRDVVSIKNTTS